MDVVDRSNGSIGFACANLLPNRLPHAYYALMGSCRGFFYSKFAKLESERQARCYGVVVGHTSLVGVRQKRLGASAVESTPKRGCAPLYELSALEPPSLASMSLLLGISMRKPCKSSIGCVATGFELHALRRTPPLKLKFVLNLHYSWKLDNILVETFRITGNRLTHNQKDS